MKILPLLLDLPVLSVQQPWAAYIVSGMKTMELRSWQPHYEGWLWIQAGKTPDAVAMDWLELKQGHFQYRALIGLVKLVRCEPIDSEAKWLASGSDHLAPGTFPGFCYGWHLSDAIHLEQIIGCPGQRRFFPIPTAELEPASWQYLETLTEEIPPELSQSLQDHARTRNCHGIGASSCTASWRSAASRWVHR